METQRREFLTYLKYECGFTRNTILSYGRDLAQMTRHMADAGITHIDQIDGPALVAYFRTRLRDGLSPRSVSRAITAVRMFLRFLVLEGAVRENCARWIETPKTWSRLPLVLNENEVDRLLAAPLAKGALPIRFPARDQAILEVFYATGARVSEVCGLTLERTRIDLGLVHITGKGDKERLVPLHARGGEAVRRYLETERPGLAARTGEDDGCLFLTRLGRRFDRVSLWRLVTRYARTAGIVRKVTPHTLRHSFATHLLAHGADLRVVQELLGHARVETTEIYTHVDRSELKRAHRKFHPRP